jgi:CelD/BcsL family acetyltransferase involved in cellulose biosynthesis
MPMTTSIVSDPRAFDALEPEWTALLARSRSNSITLTWEWLRTWWTVFHDERQLRIVLVRSDDRLIGAAPLLSRDRSHRYYGVLPFRRIELMASGEAPADQICSDYIDWIAEDGREREVVAAILALLDGELAGEWDELQLPDISAESPIVAALEREAERRCLGMQVLQREPCSVCPLPADWNRFLSGLSSSLRYKIRRGFRELEQQGGRYEVVSSADQLEDTSRILIALHQDRWTKKGRPGAFRSDKRRAFHEQLMRLALERGWLRLGVLRVKDEPIGAIYNFAYAGRISFYQSGIAATGNTNLRPGVLMHAFEIKHAIEAGCQEYDFLKRGRSDYKDMWTTHTRDLLCVRIAKPGLRNTALRALWGAEAALRGIKNLLETARPARRLPEPDAAPLT